MRQTFIFKDLNYAASKSSAAADSAATPDVLAEGAVGIYKFASNKMELVEATGGTVADTDEIVIAVGKATGAYVSPLFKAGDATRIKDAYAAGTAKVITLGSLAIPSTTTKGDEYSIRIIDTDRPDNYNQKYRFSATGVFANVAAMVDDLVAQINASDAPYTASRSTNDLVITADNPGVDFEVTAAQLMEDASITVTTPAVEPVGTPAQVAEYEKDSFDYAQGNYNNFFKFFPSPASAVDTGATYNVHFITVSPTFPSTDAMDARDSEEFKLILAFVSGDSNGSEAEVETLI